jgi:hypothetical protein
MNKLRIIAGVDIKWLGLVKGISLEGLCISCNPGNSAKFIKVCENDW